MTNDEIRPIVMPVRLPAGVAGPAPVDFDVRCFLVRHADGLVLIDTGLEGVHAVIEPALRQLGAEWGDITDIVLTHNHADHIGGLTDVVARAVRSAVWAGAEDQQAIPYDRQLRTLGEGDVVRNLRVFETPGHTPGHRSFGLEQAGVLFPGDVIGSMAGSLSRGPAAFTADGQQAERSLRSLAALEYDRMLFSHGDEVPAPFQALRRLVATA
jgi:glyoxylase-like metal-dependent hydrolase (beta-lactamase superfamily II)